MASKLEEVTKSEESILSVVKKTVALEQISADQVDISNVIQNNLVDEYYFTYNNKKYYIVRNDSDKYGIADENHTLILPPLYEKIYHPNMTMVNCIEVKSGSKVGLFNFVTGQVLAPRFDYILPSSTTPNDIGYASENGKLVELNVSDLSSWKSSQLSPWTLFSQSLPFSTELEAPKVYADYGSAYNHPTVVIVPSYMEYLKVCSSDKYIDREGDLSRAEVKKVKEESLTEKLKAFFVSVYEEGIDGREYTIESERLVVYNAESTTINSISLHSSSSFDDWAYGGASYSFLSNSLIQVKSIELNISGYSSATNFSYFEMTDQGELKALQSARIYDFTKFVEINNGYFGGNFAYYIDQPTDEHNMYVLSHLTIADLDIMRNEIFADYGYKFKSEKWQKYFAKQSWYNPRYDDVNDQLTKIDKANVATILKRKAAMQGNEEAYTKKKAVSYHSAG